MADDIEKERITAKLRELTEVLPPEWRVAMVLIGPMGADDCKPGRVCEFGCDAEDIDFAVAMLRNHYAQQYGPVLPATKLN
jgi:hypothetical protein